MLTPGDDVAYAYAPYQCYREDHGPFLSIRRYSPFEGVTSAGLLWVLALKTKSDLVVVPSGRQIFAFFYSPRDRKHQNSGCGLPRRVFTQLVKPCGVGPLLILAV